ncbi:MAG: hypothetical protein V5A62_11420 [Haloarculaceae archaeon]
MTLPAHLVPEFAPVTDGAATAVGDTYRSSVLTPRVVRMEYAPRGAFEDRPSQAFWYREGTVPEFSVTRGDGESGEADGNESADGNGEVLAIETDALRVEYAVGEPFAPETLSATVHDTGREWRYGEEGETNLGGTVRTLADFAEVLSGEQVRAVVETLCDVGVEHLENAEAERLFLWNDDDRTDVTYRLTAFPRGGVPLASEGTSRGGPLPEREVIEVDGFEGSDWTLTVDTLLDLGNVRIRAGATGDPSVTVRSVDESTVRISSVPNSRRHVPSPKDGYSGM